MKTLTIYLTKNDEGWLKELRKYAKDNHWSVSLAIRELLSTYFIENSPGIKLIKGYEKINPVDGKLTQTIEESKDKIDIVTFEAQMEQKVRGNLEVNTDIDKQVNDCVKSRLDKDGNVSCYFRDNGKEHYSFCKQFCWSSESIWGKRAVK